MPASLTVHGDGTALELTACSAQAYANPDLLQPLELPAAVADGTVLYFAAPGRVALQIRTARGVLVHTDRVSVSPERPAHIAVQLPDTERAPDIERIAQQQAPGEAQTVERLVYVAQPAPPATDAQLVAWALVGAYRITWAVYDCDGVTVRCSVVWPDGTPGQRQTLAKSHVPAAHGAIDSYTVTYGSRTLHQPAVRRDCRTGQIVHQPRLQIE